MKLKTVDIKAFRLFDEQHLDFTNEQQGGEGSCANFVSIYAPNGFGKTSLFDAIEFGMTGNIHRLKLGNFDEQVKYDSRLSDFSSFIHNKKMPNDKVFIRLGVEGYGNGEVIKEVEPGAEKSMLTGSGHNAFFTNAILSQDWFSEFLSATTAEERFRSFMRNFHQSDDLLEYHSTLKSTLTSLGREKGNHQRTIEQLKGKLKNDVDEHIIERLDKAFGELKEKGVLISWQGKIDEDSLTKLSLELDLIEGKLETEIRRHEQMLDNVQQILSGKGELLPIEKIDTQRNTITNLKGLLKEKETALAKVTQLKTLLEQASKLQQDSKVCDNELTRLSKLISGYAQFRQVLSTIDKHNQEITKCEGTAKAFQKDKERVEQQKMDVEKQKEELLRQLNVQTNRLVQLDADYAKYHQLLDDIENKGRTEVNLQAWIAKIKEERKELDLCRAHLLDVQKKVTERHIDSIVEEYKQQSLSLIEIGQRIKQKEKSIILEEESIERQATYQGQVEELLVRARGIVNELKNGVCPLCGYNYGTAEALLKSIEGNKAVSSSIEAALERIAILKEDIKAETSKADVIYQELSGIVERAIEKYDEDIVAKDKALGEYIALLSNTQSIIFEDKKNIAENYKSFEGLNQDQIRRQFECSKEQLQQSYGICEQMLTVLKGKLEEIIKQAEQNEQKRSEIQSIVQAILSNDDYQSYYRLLKKGESADDVTFSIWNINQHEKEREMADYNARLTETLTSIKKLREEERVDLTQETALTLELAKLKDDLTVAEDLLARTMLFIRRDCKMAYVSEETPVGKIFEQIGVLKKMSEKGAAESEDNKQCLGELGTLLIAAGKYNQQQLLKQEIVKANRLLAELVNRQESVKTEIAKLQEYLSKYVENFFQVDLINELYNRIDPHPEYKEVKFECDFSLTRPRLNVYMGTRDVKQDQIVPNLYFSTAQINILSFCIFLAKAMFAKTDEDQDVGCIFIDDPIQALDDINILSMIDLLRNVAFTMNKQIVITTHDQNFYGLLQKKIPQDRFNACYWEIYERGKFRRVAK